MRRFVNDHHAVGEADVAPLGSGDGVSAEKRPRVLGVGVMRTLLVFVYLTLAWPLVLPTSATFPWDIPEGIAIAAVALAVVAGINFAWRRRRWSQGDKTGRRPAFRVSLTTIPVLLVAFLLAVGAAANRAAQTQLERQRLAATDAVSVSPLDRDRGAYAVWLTDYPGAVQQMAAVVHNYRLTLAEEKEAHPSLARLLADLSAAQTHATAYLTAVEALPTERPIVQQMKALHIREARTAVAATTDYVHGLKPFNQRQLDAGDALWTRFLAQVRASSQAEEATYRRLGGYAAFKNRVDFSQLADEMSSATSTGRSGRAAPHSAAPSSPSP
jgi:hypothetical protein